MQKSRKSKLQLKFRDVERVYKVPNFLYYSSYAVIVFEILLMIGIIYYLDQVYGVAYAVLGPLFVCLFIPVWYGIQSYNAKHHPEIPCGVNFDVSSEPGKGSEAE